MLETIFAIIATITALLSIFSGIFIYILNSFKLEVKEIINLKLEQSDIRLSNIEKALTNHVTDKKIDALQKKISDLKSNVIEIKKAVTVK